MKRIFLTVALMLGTLPAHAQVSNPGIRATGTVTSGNCVQFLTAYVVQDAGAACASLTNGITPIVSGTNKGILWNNAGVLGNLATANNGVMVTNGTGVPSISTALPTGLAMQTPVSINLSNGTSLPTSALTGTLQSTQEPAHTGDVTNTAGSLALTIANAAVTNSKLANSATTVNGQTCTLGSTCTVTGGNVDNFLPNVQNQLFSGVTFGYKQVQNGSTSENPVSCSGFSISSNTPVFTCANTQQIRVGDIVTTSTASFWGYAGPGFITCAQVQCTGGNVQAARVIAVVANTSVTLQGNMGGISPASSGAQTLYVIAPGDGGTSTRGADGWDKSSSLIMFADDWPANAYPGTIRPLLLRKGSASAEYYRFTYPSNNMATFQGKTITCEMAVLSRASVGNGNFNLAFYDNVTGFSNSTVLSGNNAYQVLAFTATVSQTATLGYFEVVLSGSSGDIYYIAGPPTCAFTSSLTASQMQAPSQTVIRADGHWNPPLLTPFIISFSPSGCAAGLYCLPGAQGVDIEAISMGTVHSSISAVESKLELTGTPAMAQLFTASNLTYLTFGPHCIIQVASVTIECSGKLPMYHTDPNNLGLATFIMFTNTGGSWTPSSATFDFWDVYTGENTSLN